MISPSASPAHKKTKTQPSGKPTATDDHVHSAPDLVRAVLRDTSTSGCIEPAPCPGTPPTSRQPPLTTTPSPSQNLVPVVTRTIIDSITLLRDLDRGEPDAAALAVLLTHVHELERHLERRLQAAGAPARPPLRTYAGAAAAATAPTPSHVPPATTTTRTGTQSRTPTTTTPVTGTTTRRTRVAPGPQGPAPRMLEPQKNSPTATGRRTSVRLVVRFARNDLDTFRSQPRPHPVVLVNALNEALPMHCIRGIDYNNSGCLILLAKEPYTASQIAVLGPEIWEVIKTHFGLPDDVQEPRFDAGTPWSKVVIHSIPIPVGLEELNSPYCAGLVATDLLNDRQVMPTDIKAMRWLCSEQDCEHKCSVSTTSSPQFVSLMVAFAGKAHAARLCTQGVCVQGAHCRVSVYRPRRRV